MSSLPLSQVLSLSNAQIAIEAAATLAFALSGLIEAARKRLDAVGVCVVAIVCNEIPRAFSDHRPYALCAFAGAWVVVLADQLAMPQWLGLVAAAGCVTLLRALAMLTGWKLPAWRAD